MRIKKRNRMTAIMLAAMMTVGPALPVMAAAQVQVTSADSLTQMQAAEAAYAAAAEEYEHAIADEETKSAALVGTERRADDAYNALLVSEADADDARIEASSALQEAMVAAKENAETAADVLSEAISLKEKAEASLENAEAELETTKAHTAEMRTALDAVTAMDTISEEDITAAANEADTAAQALTEKQAEADAATLAIAGYKDDKDAKAQALDTAKAACETAQASFSAASQQADAAQAALQEASALLQDIMAIPKVKNSAQYEEYTEASENADKVAADLETARDDMDAAENVSQEELDYLDQCILSTNARLSEERQVLAAWYAELENYRHSLDAKNAEVDAFSAEEAQHLSAISQADEDYSSALQDLAEAEESFLELKDIPEISPAYEKLQAADAAVLNAEADAEAALLAKGAAQSEVVNASSTVARAEAADEEASSALSNAETVLAAQVGKTQNALALLNTARTAAEQARSSDNSAGTALDGAEQEVSNAQTVLEETVAEKETADALVIEKADALEAAQQAYDDVYHVWTDGMFGMLEWLIESGAHPELTDAQTSINLLNQSTEIANTIRGDLNDATSMPNIIATLPYLRECNTIRTAHERDEYKIALRNMAAAEACLNWSMADSSRTHCKLFNLALWENLMKHASYDPYAEWFYSEKRKAEAGETTGIGHYRNLMFANLVKTGFAVKLITLESGTVMPGCFLQNMSLPYVGNSAGAMMTIDEFEALIYEYLEASGYTPAENALKEAESAHAAAVEAQAAAEQAVFEAEATLAEAQRAKTSAEIAKERSAQSLASAEANEAAAQDAYNAEVNAQDGLQYEVDARTADKAETATALESARQALSDAEAALAAAESDYTEKAAAITAIRVSRDETYTNIIADLTNAGLTDAANICGNVQTDRAAAEMAAGTKASEQNVLEVCRTAKAAAAIEAAEFQEMVGLREAWIADKNEVIAELIAYRDQKVEESESASEKKDNWETAKHNLWAAEVTKEEADNILAETRAALDALVDEVSAGLNAQIEEATAAFEQASQAAVSAQMAYDNASDSLDEAQGAYDTACTAYDEQVELHGITLLEEEVEKANKAAWAAQQALEEIIAQREIQRNAEKAVADAETAEAEAGARVSSAESVLAGAQQTASDAENGKANADAYLERLTGMTVDDLIGISADDPLYTIAEPYATASAAFSTAQREYEEAANALKEAEKAYENAMTVTEQAEDAKYDAENWCAELLAWEECPASITKDEDVTLTLTTNASVQFFRNIIVDGTPLVSSGYSISDDRHSFTLKTEVLNLLLAGTHTIQFNYDYGILTADIDVDLPRDITLADISIDTTFVSYDGLPQIPEVVVSMYNDLLIYGTDYSLALFNNVNAGTATLKVIGRGEFTGSVTRTFNIPKGNISRAIVTGISTSYKYTGSYIKPTVKVVCGLRTLTPGVDYTVAYAANKTPGQATVTITGVGNYTGSIKKSFLILPKDCKIASVSNKSSGIVVKWDKCSYASGYYIYRDGKRIATVSNTTFTYTDTTAVNGTKYAYRVTAYRTINGTKKRGGYANTVNMVRLPSATVSSAANTAAGKLTVKWKKNSKATGYQVRYVLGSTKKTYTITSKSTVSKVLSGLTKGKTYKVYVRSYKTVSGKKYYSAWSGAKKVKVTK